MGKANANKKKNHKELVKIEAKKYQKELDLEITLKGLQEEEMTDDYRHHNDVKEVYKQRPQHIEIVFADGKMKYGLRNTYFRTKKRKEIKWNIYIC